MKKLYQVLILFVLYLVTLGIRIYWITEKKGLHLDEGLSLSFSYYDERPSYQNIEFNRKYTGQDLKEITFMNEGDNSLKSVLDDIVRLWKNSGDVANSNLYYSFLRLSGAGEGLKTGNLQSAIFRSCILNLLFFTISFVFFFLLMKQLFPESEILQLAMTFCAFLSTGTISNTLYIRTYQMQEATFIIFCYFIIRSLTWKKYTFKVDKSCVLNYKLVIFSSLITMLVLLSGYYATFFIGLFGLYIIYFYSQKRNKYIKIGFYFAVLGLGLLFARLFYLKYFLGFYHPWARGTLQNFFETPLDNLQRSMSAVGCILHAHFFSYPIICLCALLFLIVVIGVKKKRFRILPQKSALVILMISILYIIVILIIALYKELRYTMPVFPFLIIFPAIMINMLGKRNLAVFAMLVFCFCFLKGALDRKDVAFLFSNQPGEYAAFSQDVEVPVLIFNKAAWKYNDLMPYLNDVQEYHFLNTWEDFDLVSRGECYLVFERTDVAIPDEYLSRFEIEKEWNAGTYFACKKLRYLEDGNQ